MEFSIHICEYNRSNTDCETIYRPEGSGDYLFLLFKTPMKVYDGTAFIIAQENACLFYTLDHEQHYQAVQKFRNSYVHFWCGENLGEKYGIPQNTVFYPQNTEAIGIRGSAGPSDDDHGIARHAAVSADGGGAGRTVPGISGAAPCDAEPL